MKKAILIGLLALLWLALKLMVRWFGHPDPNNAAADLALLLITAVAAVVVGVFLMKADDSEGKRKKSQARESIEASIAPLAPANAPPQAAPPAADAAPTRTQATAPPTQIAGAVPGRAPADAGTLFCPTCGTGARGGKFCQQCGGALQPRTACPQCGVQFAEGTKFCRECGTRVVA